MAMAATRPADAGVVLPTVGSGLTGAAPAAGPVATYGVPPPTQPMGASPSWMPPAQTGPAGYGLPAQIPATIGMTTSQPVSAEAEIPRPPGTERSTPLLAAIAAVVGFVVVGGVAFLAVRSSDAPEAPAQSASAPPAATSVAPPATSNAGLAPLPPAAPVSAPAATSAAPETPATASTKPKAPPPVVIAPPAVTVTAPPVCHVVSFFDADGNKHFRQECQ
jgi:hypothetical protein